MAALLSLGAGSGCGLPERPAPERGFRVRYEKSDAADRDEQRFLRDRGLAESTAADLNAYVGLPYAVEVVARSCHGEGTGYDPDTHRIELCYDDLAEQRGSHDDEELSALVRETLHHEAGHALIDALDLPDQGERAEEDAADGFAQVMLLRGRPEGEETLLIAARDYDLAAAADPVPDPADEHAPDAARAESHRCAVYGYAAGRREDLATPARAGCAATWARTRDTWTRDLAPLLRH
ncbi:hypothetical protein SAVIM338S_04665 [Streptomyces avidinii]